MSNSQEKILIITGMHRSGTSLTSSLLQSAGLDIGKNLVPGNEGNPKGHFENREFVNFHESLLYSLGIDKIGWTVNPNIFVPPYYVDQARKLIEENSCSSGPWGWKEPRTTLLLDFWGNLLPAANFLFVYRAPWEVIDSLYRRGDDIFHNHPEFAVEIWNFYNKLIIDFYHHQPDRCLIVNINSIIKDPSWLVKTIEDKFSITLSEPDSSLCDLNLIKRQESQSQRPQIIKRHFPDTFQIYVDLNAIAQYDDPLLLELQKSSSNTWVLQDWLDAKRIQRKLKHEQQNSSDHLERVYQQLGESRGKVGELEYKLEQLEYKLEQSQQESSQLHSQLEQSQQKSTQLHSQLEQLQQESQQQSTQLYSQLEKFQQEYNQLYSQIEQSQQEYNQLRSQLEQSQQESYQLRSQLAQSQRQSVQLVSQLEQSQQESLQLRSQLAQSQQESLQLRSQLEQTQQESDRLRSQLTLSNERIQAMETSKFWKIRKNWFKIKRRLGMKDNE